MAESLVALRPEIADLGFAKHEDVTDLISEWEGCLLDPISALLAEIPKLTLAENEWKLRGRATLSASVMKQLRLAATDPDLVKAMEGVLPALVKDGRLRPAATPLLLGMAASASVKAGIGTQSYRIACLLKSKGS